MLEIRRELQDLRRDVSEIKGLLVNFLTNGDHTVDLLSVGSTVIFPEIPQEVVAKFLDAAQINAPESFQGLSDMPLTEGFDALVYHFSQVSRCRWRMMVNTHRKVKSTVEFNPGFDNSQRIPEETQFVNLLKSKWILGELESSSHLNASGTSSLWTGALGELKSVRLGARGFMARGLTVRTYRTSSKSIQGLILIN